MDVAVSVGAMTPWVKRLENWETESLDNGTSLLWLCRSSIRLLFFVKNLSCRLRAAYPDLISLSASASISSNFWSSLAASVPSYTVAKPK